METVTATELHDRTSELTEKVMRDPERPILIEKHGKPAVVLVDARYFEGLLETLDILADPATLAQLRKGIADADAGRVISHEQLGKELGLDAGKDHHPMGDQRRKHAARNRKPNHKTKAVRKGGRPSSARAA